MLISDWSSDVCSSDLFKGLRAISPSSFIARNTGLSESFSRIHSEIASRISDKRKGTRHPPPSQIAPGINALHDSTTIRLRRKHRKRVEYGKRVSEHLDFGGQRTIKKKKITQSIN